MLLGKGGPMQALVAGAMASSRPVSVLMAEPAVAWQALERSPITRVTDGAELALTSTWREDERAAVFFFRSFG